MQSKFDEFQLIDLYKKDDYDAKKTAQSDNVSDMLDLIRNLNVKLQKSIENLTHYFMPACISHMLLRKK